PGPIPPPARPRAPRARGPPPRSRRFARAGQMARPQRRHAAVARRRRGGLAQRARLLSATLVQRNVAPALHALGRHVVGSLTVPGEQYQATARAPPPRWGSAVATMEERKGVRPQAKPKRLQRDHVLGEDVAEVDLGAVLLDEPDLLVLLRRLEDQARLIHLVDDLVDQAGARLAVGPVEAGVAGRPPLADHV